MLRPGSPGRDTIAFDIPGTGVKTIHPLSPLPTISDSIIIDGYTQLGSSANSNGPDQGTNALLLVELNLDVADGIRLSADQSVVRGLVIHGAPNTANIIVGSAPGTIGGPMGGAGTVIEGNFIGTNPAGTASRRQPGERRRCLRPGQQRPHRRDHAGRAQPHLRGRPGDRPRAGLSGAGGGDGDRAGESDRGPTRRGWSVSNVSSDTNSGTVGINIVESVGDHLIGGAAPGSRNVIVGFDRGIQIAADTITSTGDNTIQGNFIGLDVTGSASLPNRIGLLINLQPGSRNFIGGAAAGEGNVISGNRLANVELGSGLGNRVQGNLIGTNAAGTGPPTGLPSGSGSSVGVILGGTRNSIGGTTAGAGNVIAFNTAQGVFVNDSNAESNLILGNSIDFNGRLGIDLLGQDGPGGVNSNNSGPFNVANRGQNYPTITGIAAGAISGTFHSDPSQTYRIEFFASAAADPTGFGEGQTYLGFLAVTTDASGNATFSAPVAALPAGQAVLSATATDPSGNTSEFSGAVTTGSIPASADLAVAITATPDPVAPGGLLTYTITVANSGPDAAETPTLTIPIPATGDTFVSFTLPEGWTATTPAVGNFGTITATAATLASGSGGTALFTLVVRVDPTASPGGDPTSAGRDRVRHARHGRLEQPGARADDDRGGTAGRLRRPQRLRELHARPGRGRVAPDLQHHGREQRPRRGGRGEPDHLHPALGRPVRFVHNPRRVDGHHAPGGRGRRDHRDHPLARPRHVRVHPCREGRGDGRRRVGPPIDRTGSLLHDGPEPREQQRDREHGGRRRPAPQLGRHPRRRRR